MAELGKFISRFSKRGTIKKVREELTGSKARARFLAQCGYPNEPQGLMQRLDNKLREVLPLAVSPLHLAVFGRLFDGSQLLQQARQISLNFPAPGSPMPLLWPWLSGQGGLQLARAACLNDEFNRSFSRWLEAMLTAGKDMAGPGWQDKRLLAFRVINILFSLGFLSQPSKLAPDICADVLLHLYLAGQILQQELDAHPIPQPDQAETATALLLLGLSCDFLAEAVKWRESGSARLGPSIMELENCHQVYSLGHMNSILQCAAIAQWLSRSSSLNLPLLLGAIYKLASWMRALAPPWTDGRLPGQSQYGPLLFSSQPCSGEAANLAALLYTAQELRGPRRISELLFWLMGENAEESLRMLAGGAAPGAIDIEAAAMSGLCTRWHFRSLGVWLISGPRSGRDALPWPLNHGLSLYLFRQGKPLLLAPAKVEKGPLAQYSQSRQAMNAMLLGEQPPADGLIELEGLEQKGTQFFAAASFNGYSGIMLRRRIFLDEPVINIVDQIQAQGQHLCQAYFHFPPQARVSPAPRSGFIIDLHGEKWWFKADPRAQAKLVQGQANPPLGWALNGGNSMLPSPTIVVEAQIVGSTRLNLSLALLPSEPL